MAERRLKMRRVVVVVVVVGPGRSGGVTSHTDEEIDPLATTQRKYKSESKINAGTLITF